ncbi:unnamed protein product [Caenorhabditis auriculariae]|uniref:Uncharacterized protein n=1 Tax=Caenorhabditis auriculariae TaxID=2777116 RepID=A0A8S1GXS8_9PELO|nr:unnamed protein product [Caenorhabditis auriculariae]
MVVLWRFEDPPAIVTSFITTIIYASYLALLGQFAIVGPPDLSPYSPEAQAYLDTLHGDQPLDEYTFMHLLFRRQGQQTIRQTLCDKDGNCYEVADTVRRDGNNIVPERRIQKKEPANDTRISDHVLLKIPLAMSPSKARTDDWIAEPEILPDESFALDALSELFASGAVSLSKFSKLRILVIGGISLLERFLGVYFPNVIVTKVIAAEAVEKLSAKWIWKDFKKNGSEIIDSLDKCGTKYELIVVDSFTNYEKVETLHKLRDSLKQEGTFVVNFYASKEQQFFEKLYVLQGVFEHCFLYDVRGRNNKMVVCRNEPFPENYANSHLKARNYLLALSQTKRVPKFNFQMIHG